MMRRSFLTAVGLSAVGAATAPTAAPGSGGAVAARPRGLLALIGSYTSSNPAGRGLEIARRAPSGALESAGVVDGVPDASFFAWSPDHRFVYVTNERPDGSVTAIEVTGHRPRVLNSRSTRGAGPTHLAVHPDGDFLFTANYTDGSVVVHRRDADGSIGESTDLVRHPGSEPHAHQVVVDPSKRWVISVDLGDDSVFVYALDHGTGELTEHQHLQLPTGTGPRHLVFHPDAERAYLVAELRSEVTVLAWDAEDGRLTPGLVVGTRRDGASGENYPGEIAVSRDGRFVHASNRGDDDIAVFAVDGPGLRPIGNTPAGGNWPRHFALAPEETSLYVANQRSGTITRLSRDPDSGALSPSPDRYDCPSVAAITFHG
ncbi:lactonase family protein [Saccharopolyspora rosea]|uniref:Lactonase family protein n=1 Tax=Saccharopolyspora rosea TaxID=524884 RepID=A0ABW3FXE0_9PSEU|nr:lactonase family protein [Saccharopolyspora rosea]